MWKVGVSNLACFIVVEVGCMGQATLSCCVVANWKRRAEKVSSPLLFPASAAAYHPAVGCRRVPQNCSAGLTRLLLSF